MTKKSAKKIYLFTGIAIFLIAGIGFTISNPEEIYAYRVPVPNNITFEINNDGSYSGVVNGIPCFTKVTNLALDVNGRLITDTDSAFFISNPAVKLSIVDGKSGSVVDEFEVTVKSRCDIDTQENLPMEFSTGSLKLLVSATYPNGIKQVWNGEKQFKNVPITFNHEEELVTFNVKRVDLEKFLPEGEYTTKLRFSVSGTTDLKFVTSPFNALDIELIMVIPNESVTTEFIMEITKDEPAEEGGTGGNGEECLQLCDGVQDEDSDNDLNEITIYDEFFLCLDAQDIDCLTQTKFMVSGVVGLSGLFIISAVLYHKTKTFDALGRPTN